MKNLLIILVLAFSVSVVNAQSESKEIDTLEEELRVKVSEHEFLYAGIYFLGNIMVEKFTDEMISLSFEGESFYLLPRVSKLFILVGVEGSQLKLCEWDAEDPTLITLRKRTAILRRIVNEL